jgi:very-short-patch-repair endonuclease
MPESGLERLMAWQLEGTPGIPPWVRELRFHDTRQWRFDFAWPQSMLALEIEGGEWSQGRHVRGGGFGADCEKYNAAAVLGWRVLRVTGRMVERGEALLLVKQALGKGDG